MEIGEVMDCMQELLDILHEVGDLHTKNAETQRLIAKGAFAGAAGMKRLTMLLLYKDTGEEGNGNGGGNGDAGRGDHLDNRNGG